VFLPDESCRGNRGPAIGPRRVGKALRGEAVQHGGLQALRRKRREQRGAAHAEHGERPDGVGDLLRLERDDKVRVLGPAPPPCNGLRFACFVNF
jgi:hypothetical protein